ncbi:hypothetical protein EIP91_004773 [Steccherinum ochraceum]|uniref:Uncharacterized protein n=1 Tax=Steccherinum ochraceum TaxID=92696 RepID=A0A4R0RAS9_9APHY|nr:hypothetical protein EIP91_004773 [Steccherinum ochraceum]
MSSTLPTNFPVLQVDLTGRTALVVGSNVGLGFEAAKHLARMNPKRLIATARTEEKSKKTEEEIKKDTGFSAVECWPLELTSFASIKAFADRFEPMADPTYVITEDGFERLWVLCFYSYSNIDTDCLSPSSLQTNHLGGALLSYLLLPTLLKTGRETGHVSRLAIVSSNLHECVNFGLEKFPKDRDIFARMNEKDSLNTNVGDLANRYSETKLLNILFGRALQSHLSADAPLLVTLPNPGLSISELGRSDNSGQWDEVLKTARTTEEGSRQLILGALGEKGGVNAWRGAYLSDNEIRDVSEWVRSDEGREAQERVWKETLIIASKADARVAETAKLFV